MGTKMKISAFMAAMLVLPCFTSSLMAQATPPLSACVGEVKAPACDAVRGDRADGWREQSRAEVMAPHAMVTTSQPLAAQAGLQIMPLRGVEWVILAYRGSVFFGPILLFDRHHPSVPTCTRDMPTRAAAVKDGPPSGHRFSGAQRP